MTSAGEDRREGRWSKLRWAFAGAASLGAAAVIGAVAVMEFGLFNVAASTAHLPEVGWFVHRVMQHSVHNRARDIEAPRRASPDAVAKGFCEYHEHCQMCHGGPTVARDPWANGINPPPPYLIDAAARWRPNQLYWIVENGVKMTAMPAWNASMSKQQIWSLVAFLETMPKMSPGVYAKWAGAPQCPSALDVVTALQLDPRPTNLPTSIPALARRGRAVARR